MTRAWAPNGHDVVDWPAGKGLVIEDEAPDWRSRAAKTKWSNPETAARMRLRRERTKTIEAPA